MSQVFFGGASIMGVITWLMTTYYAFLNWGFLGAAAAFFIPPLDIVFMFMLGTWQIGLIALVLFGIGIATSKK